MHFISRCLVRWLYTGRAAVQQADISWQALYPLLCLV